MAKKLTKAAFVPPETNTHEQAGVRKSGWELYQVERAQRAKARGEMDALTGGSVETFVARTRDLIAHMGVEDKVERDVLARAFVADIARWKNHIGMAEEILDRCPYDDLEVDYHLKRRDKLRAA